MSTNEQKVTILTNDKDKNLIEITDLENYIINLDIQIASNLSMNDSYEVEKTNSADKIIELESANSIIDDMIADYS
jgi:hypothetical protein